MKKEIIYVASNIAEANAIVDLLASYEVTAEAQLKEDDEKLGMQRPIGLVPILVKTENVEESISRIQLWNKENDALQAKNKSKPNPTFRAVLLGIILGLGITVFHYESKYIFTPEHIEANLNDDGYFYKNDALIRFEVDQNDDGKIDEITHYNEFEERISTDGDYNFNGVFETVTTYKSQSISTITVDSDEDRKVDLKHFYEKAQWYKTEYYDFKTKKVFKVDKSNGLFVIESKIDEDKDGTFDMIFKYNQYGNQVHQQKINEK